MKLNLICIVMAVLLVLIMFSCKNKKEKTPEVKTDNSEMADMSGNPNEPGKRLIIEEFNEIWYSVHGHKDTGKNWMLINAEVGSIRAEKDAKTATVNIKFTYTPGSKPQRTKSADFMFQKIEGLWEIDKTTAKFPITP